MTDERPPDDPPDDDDPYLRVAGLLLLLPVAVVLPIFIRAICRNILQDPKVAEDRHLASNEDLKKICTFEGLVTAHYLWRMSELPGEDAFAAAGMTPGCELDPPTSTSMGKDAHAASGYPEELAEQISIESCIICRRRIVDGLVRFGYAEKDEERPSYRPVYATAKLDAVMIEFTREYLKVLGDVMDGPAKDGGTDGREGE